MPSFGPPLPKDPLFAKSRDFREFLLAKIVNADSVGNKIGIFTQIRMRTRKDALEDLIAKHSTKFTLDNCGNGLANSHHSSSGSSLAHKLAMFGFGSVKQRKMRSKSLQMFHNNNNSINGSLVESSKALAHSQCKLSGALFWRIEQVTDSRCEVTEDVCLGISRQYVVIVKPEEKSVLFAIGCNAVIGWTMIETENRFVLYFDLGEHVSVRLKSRGELDCVIRRLEKFTKGCMVSGNVRPLKCNQWR